MLDGRDPHPTLRAKYIELAIEHAQQRLTDWEIDPPHDQPVLPWR
jgi:hypothetical protein